MKEEFKGINKNYLEEKKEAKIMLKKILRTLEYKCIWSSKIFHQISTYYPSSQKC